MNCPELNKKNRVFFKRVLSDALPIHSSQKLSQDASAFVSVAAVVVAVAILVVSLGQVQV